jgi:outer membrane biosynthesis protein TonB
MRFCRSSAQPTPDSMRDTVRNACHRAALPLAAVLLAAFLPGFPAKAQSASPKPTPAEPQSQASSENSSQAEPQSQRSAQPVSQPAPATPALQTVPGAKQETLGDAARKNAQKPKPRPQHVYTDDDLSGMGGAISVVGDASSSGQAADDSSAQADGTSSGESKDEAYWRGRADAIKRQIADVNRQIEDKKAEIAKAGPASFDPSAGLSQGVIVIHDRNAELKDLEDRKQNLENQLDQLADEGRKAGADSGWFR